MTWVHFAHGKTLDTTFESCSSNPGLLVSLEIPAEAKAEFANSGRSLVIPLPAQTCVYRGQIVSLHIRGPQNQLVLWGRGTISEVRRSAEPHAVVVAGQPLITEEILATHCQGHCTAVVDRLPPPSPQRVFLDLRRQPDLLFEIPGAISIPMPTPEQFPWSQFSNKNLSYYLIPEGPQLSESAILPLMSEMRNRGYTQVYWYHPGALGLLGFELPALPPQPFRQITIQAMPELRLRGGRMMYVGLKSRFKASKKSPLPNITAFYREKNLSALSARNSFENRPNIDNFDFSPKAIPRRTPLVIYDFDATDPYKYQAFQALTQLGYSELYVLPSGLLGLKESQANTGTNRKTKPVAMPDTQIAPSIIENQLPCERAAFENSKVPQLFLSATEAEQAQSFGQLTLRRRIDLTCLSEGDEVILSRFEATSKTAFRLGSAHLIQSRARAAGEFEMVLKVHSFSEAESRELAPYCTGCKITLSLNSLKDRKPIALILNSEIAPSELESIEKLHVQITPTNLQALDHLKLPPDLTRPLIVYWPRPRVEWRGLLSWLETFQKRTGREVYWLYQHPKPEARPSKIPGVVEVDGQWLASLEKNRATAIFLQDYNPASWNAPSMRINSSVNLPDRALGNLFDADLAAIEPSLREKMPGLFKLDPLSTKIVVMSQGLDDFAAYYLARTLVTRHFRQVYWYRSSGDAWKKKIAFDPAPSEN